MARSLRPRCSTCAEPLTSADPLCVRCTANPSPPGLPPNFAAYDPNRRGAFYQFFSGMRFFLAALPYALRTRGVKRHIAVPIVITIVLLVVLVVSVLVLASWMLGPAGEGATAQIGRTLLQVIIVAALLVGAYLLFFPLARVLLAPFADKISERVEALALGDPPSTAFELAPAATDAARALVEAIKMLALQLSITVPLLIIPVAGPVLAVLAGIFFNGLGAMDIAMGRKRMGLREKLGFARAHLGFVLGLGASIYLVMLVPVVNLLAIPLGAVASTMGFLRIQQS